MTDDSFGLLHPGVQYHLANTLRWDGLRPTQAAAVAPILAGDDALVLAPTAGGKTEAAAFPLLSAMAEHDWQGTSVLYVCPLRALLNNLQPRLHGYAQWLGRSAAVWHGDVGQSARTRILRERPDILLTTPESLEAMLVSTKVDPRVLFAGLRAVVVDEVHAFAGDDRGWHLLAVLERLGRVAGRDIQRIGLSATVGNPDELLAWLQGSATGRPRRVVAPETGKPATEPDITVDYVGSVSNAATVIASLHQGEKRLVFVDSRRRAEELGAALRDRGITTFLSHSSLSAAERRQSEEAFAESRDTVIVATSTLELGIDVGDLDRVIQIGAPRTVASFLQRLGRTGRRAGTSRNCLFLCLDDEQELLALGMLDRWARGWVEPITPPPSPRHIAAQQMMALCLQEHRIGVASWRQWWGSLPVFDDTADNIMKFLCEQGFFDRDGEFLHIGPEAERRFGRRYFSDLTAVFSAPPEFTVLAGRNEVGTIGTDLFDRGDRWAENPAPRRSVVEGHSYRLEATTVLRRTRRLWWTSQVVRSRWWCVVRDRARHAIGAARCDATRCHADSTSRINPRRPACELSACGRYRCSGHRPSIRRQRTMVDVGGYCSQPHPAGLVAVSDRLSTTHRRKVVAPASRCHGTRCVRRARADCVARADGRGQCGVGTEVFRRVAAGARGADLGRATR